MFEKIINSGVPVRLGSDARCCSPGHTTKFGSYSIMDLNSSKVVDIQLVRVRIPKDLKKFMYGTLLKKNNINDHCERMIILVRFRISFCEIKEYQII